MSIIEESGSVIQQGRQVAVERAPYDDRTWRRMENKVALITGGARGMGAAQARLFAAEGARVMVTDVLDDLGKQVADEIGTAAVYAHLDVSSEEQWAAAVDLAAEAFGPVNTLAHCAGIARFGLIENLPLSEYQEVLQVNLVGAFLGIKACIAPMTEAGGGSIVLISSIDGLASHPAFSAYCSAKSGLFGLARAAALELAPRGIRVNTISPGVIDTPMIRPEGVDRSVLAGFESQIPLGHAGDPSELARAAMFLASDDSRYVTGTNLTVDGGVMAQVPLTLG